MDETDPEKITLGKHLAQARRLAEMSQDAVAEALRQAGFAVQDKRTVSAWENGRNIPDALVVRKLAQLYDTTADSLLGLQLHSAEAERLATVFDSLSEPQRIGFLDVCGPFLEKHARNADVFARVHSDEEMTPEQRRAADANEQAMQRRPSRRTRAA